MALNERVSVLGNQLEIKKKDLEENIKQKIILETTVSEKKKLVKDLKAAGCRVMAEGRYNTPELAKTAIEIGAYCVTVGSALTRLEHIVSWFAKAIHSAKK